MNAAILAATAPLREEVSRRTVGRVVDQAVARATTADLENQLAGLRLGGN